MKETVYVVRLEGADEDDRRKRVRSREDARACNLVQLDTLHKSLRVTRAMAAGIVDKLWSFEDISEAIDARAPRPSLQSPYKNRAAVADAQGTLHQDH